VLRGVSFEMAAGESLAVVGPSGSGKSTLLHIIGTLDRPTSGEVRIDGQTPHALSEPELAAFRNRRIGFVFQDHHLLPQYSVLENVLMPALVAGRDHTQAAGRARSLLERVGLERRLGHRPAELSGGERQRAAVARALLNRPGLLLCDEPTGNLDAASAASVASLLFELHREEAGLLILVTHSAELAARAGRRMRLSEGLCSDL
jgi:lipoprotein-releasing system ATP-binding protein